MRGVMTVTDTAFYLKSTEDAVYALVRADAIPYRKQGRRILFLRDEIDAWLRGLPGNTVEQALMALARMPSPTPSHQPADLTLTEARHRGHIPRRARSPGI